MVSTRRSRKSTEPTNDETPAANHEITDANDESSTPTPSKRKGRKKNQRDELKSKNTGVGLAISIDDEDSAAKQNKKIVFGDDEEGDALVEREDPEPNAGGGNDNEEAGDGDKPETIENEAKEDQDEDADDAVEEVKGSKAREEVLHQLEAEEKGAVKVKKTRNRKGRVKEDQEQGEESEDELDDDFFAELETVKAEESQKQTDAQKKKKKKGKHTTFVFDENNDGKGDNLDPSKSRDVGHNIQVVVLPIQEDGPMDDAITAFPTGTLSEEALLYSRSQLNNGFDKSVAGKRKRNAPVRPDTSWKRSRKMNLLLTPKSRFHRKGRKGRPAANFATKSINSQR